MSAHPFDEIPRRNTELSPGEHIAELIQANTGVEWTAALHLAELIRTYMRGRL